MGMKKIILNKIKNKLAILSKDGILHAD